MRIREYTAKDLNGLRRIHAAQGFDYALPDLSNPLFVTKLVMTSGGPASLVVAQHAAPLQRGSTRSNARHNGAIVGAALLRLTAAAYLLLDPRAGTPRQR